ncbi:MAG: hypothetical protein HY903_16925 [Deltaproteobacteria bacterium]|nr:hypothetical protein [Deltaproteobacteria bacterium]
MHMRTTLTIEEDVSNRLNDYCRRTRKGLKEAVNELLRLGLEAPRAMRPATRFEVRARGLRQQPGISLDNVAELLERIEGPAHR